MKIDFKIKDGKRVVVGFNSDVTASNYQSIISMIAELTVKSVEDVNAAQVTARKEEVVVKPDEEKEEIKKTGTGYRGYMHLVCDKCGRVQSFFPSGEIEERECSCGNVITLYHLKKINYACKKCGRDYTYWTNRTEPDFRINCKDCKESNEVSYDVDLGSYVNKFKQGE